MKKQLLFIISLFFIHTLNAQSPDTLKAWFYRAFDMAQQQSLYAAEINWDSLKAELEPAAQKMQTLDDLKAPLSGIINALRDHHGRFFYKFQPLAYLTDYSKPSRGKPQKPSIRYSVALMKRTEYGHAFEMKGKDIGYLRIVGIGPQQDIQQEAKVIRDGIAGLARQGATKWILDLRFNGGGNMYPMLEGLAPLLGEGKIGGAQFASGWTADWYIQDGDFYRSGYGPIHLPPNPEISPEAKVAVLISPFTMSSGEVVATCFKERKNTIFIGEATGGYVTETNWQPISEDLFMSIAVSRYMDRTGKIYYVDIQPDVEIDLGAPPEKLDAKMINEDIEAAIDWLKK